MIGNCKVITLCGSTRFKDEFMEVQKRLTSEGNIVFSVGHSSDNEVCDYSGPPAHPGRSSAQLDRASAHFIRSAVQPMLAADQRTC